MPSRVKALLGVLAIAAIIGGLWAAYRPPVRTIPPAHETPAPPRLDNARADVLLRQAGATHRATIACDGDQIDTTGFWAEDPVGACFALASTRGALLAGPGCPKLPDGGTSLRVTGAFGEQRFTRQAPLGGCPADEDWLAIDVFASPVLGAQRKAEDARP